MDMIPILTSNNTQLSNLETSIRGQIIQLEEELIRIRAKRDHNDELLEVLRSVEKNNPTPDTGPEQS